MRYMSSYDSLIMLSTVEFQLEADMSELGIEGID